MVDRFYGYQYDTSPRKLSQEQTPYRNRYSQRNGIDASINIQTNDANNLKNSRNRSSHFNNSDVDSIVNKKSSAGVKNSSASRKNFHANYEGIEKQKNQNNIQSNIRNNAKKNNNIKSKLKMVMFLIAGFSMLFAISYQNSLISESFNKKEQYKKEMEALNKTNQQIEVSIENSLNLNNIEQAAKDKLGMQKLDNNQKIYVSLPKQDYVAPATEQIVMEEEIGFFEKLIKGFTRTIK